MTQTTARGTGRTSQQMRSAPTEAVFVWPVHRSMDYAVALARHIGRTDLQIVSPGWFEDSRWRGLQRPVVVDHATPDHMDRSQSDALYDCLRYLRECGVQQ